MAEFELISTLPRFKPVEIFKWLPKAAVVPQYLVFRAFDSATNQPVVVKWYSNLGPTRPFESTVEAQLNPDYGFGLDHEIEIYQRFEAEGGHPNISKLVDSRSNGSTKWLAIADVGIDLQAAGVENMNFRQVVRIVRDVATAITFGHRFGVRFYDLNPNNVTVRRGITPATPNEQMGVRLIDFAESQIRAEGPSLIAVKNELADIIGIIDAYRDSKPDAFELIAVRVEEVRRYANSLNSFDISNDPMAILANDLQPLLVNPEGISLPRVLRRPEPRQIPGF